MFIYFILKIQPNTPYYIEYRILNLRKNLKSKFDKKFPENIIYLESLFLENQYFIRTLNTKSENYSEMTFFYLQDQNMVSIKSNQFIRFPNLNC